MKIDSVSVLRAQVESPSTSHELSRVQKHVLATFESLHKPLVRYLLWMRVRPDRIEDIVQEAFMRLHDHLKSHKLSESNLQGWVWKVTHNLALKQFMNEVREDSFVRLDLTADYTFPALKDPKPSPEETLCLDEKQKRALRALRDLTERERQCLHLRSEGLGYREIGEVLGIGRSTVADTLQRAIGILQRIIHE